MAAKKHTLLLHTIKSMPNLLMAPQQPFLEVSPYLNHRISMDAKDPISPSSDGKSYVYVIVDAFTLYIVFHPSPRNDATKALTVLFDHWVVKFGIPEILVTGKWNEYINGEFAHFCRTYNVQFKPRTPYAPCSNGRVENSNRQINTFLRTVLDSKNDTRSEKIKYFPLHSTHKFEPIWIFHHVNLSLAKNQKTHNVQSIFRYR